MWYVLAAKPGAALVYGFNQDMDACRVRDALANRTIAKYLNHVPVRKDDLFYIEAGTVHAIGAGAVIAEIQESSNITYCLYDYDRVDKNGKHRELHVDKALAVANLSASNSPRQPMRVLRYKNGCASELLTRCKYFQVERLILNTEVHRNLATYQTDSTSFHALLCVDGCGVLFGDGGGSENGFNSNANSSSDSEYAGFGVVKSVDGNHSCGANIGENYDTCSVDSGNVTIPFFKGDCIFVPADSMPLKLHGKAQVLDVRC